MHGSQTAFCVWERKNSEVSCFFSPQGHIARNEIPSLGETNKREKNNQELFDE